MGLGDFFSAIGSAISSVCAAIGGPLGLALTAGLTALNPILGLIVAAIPLIIKIIDILAPKEVKAEDIESGKLAVMAASCPDIKPENYETVSDYISALYKEADTKETDLKVANLSPEQKIAYQLASVAMLGPFVAEKLGAKDGEFDLAFIAKANVLGLDGEKTVAFVKDLQAAGVTTTEANKYFEGSLSGDDLGRVDDGIKAAIEKLDPSVKTDEQKDAFLVNWSEKIDDATANQSQKG